MCPYWGVLNGVSLRGCPYACVLTGVCLLGCPYWGVLTGVSLLGCPYWCVLTGASLLVFPYLDACPYWGVLTGVSLLVVLTAWSVLTRNASGRLLSARPYWYIYMSLILCVFAAVLSLGMFMLCGSFGCWCGNPIEYTVLCGHGCCSRRREMASWIIGRLCRYSRCTSNV